MALPAYSGGTAHSNAAPVAALLACVQKTLERAYGRVDRSALRHHLLTRCAAAGVTYVKALVTDIDADPAAAAATVHTSATPPITARLATLAGGAVSAKFLSFESGAPPVAAQTAYGVLARVRNYEDVYNPEAMLFMDYRRLHSGMWDNAGRALFGRSADARAATAPQHPNWNASYGTTGEAPSFLYAMPLGDGQVFLEETCLVARPTLPFSALKQRLERRCRAMGIEIEEVRSTGRAACTAHRPHHRTRLTSPDALCTFECCFEWEHRGCVCRLAWPPVAAACCSEGGMVVRRCWMKSFRISRSEVRCLGGTRR